eukprot:m.97096 g.97096  ORF g.97096 m.97096 type:complete len:142 (-) comp10202_c0_seq2:4455-4880(-)
MMLKQEVYHNAVDTIPRALCLTALHPCTVWVVEPLCISVATHATLLVYHSCVLLLIMVFVELTADDISDYDAFKAERAASQAKAASLLATAAGDGSTGASSVAGATAGSTASSVHGVAPTRQEKRSNVKARIGYAGEDDDQ